MIKVFLLFILRLMKSTPKTTPDQEPILQVWRFYFSNFVKFNMFYNELYILIDVCVCLPEMWSEAIKILKGEYTVRAIKEHKIDQAIIFCRTKIDCDNMEQYFIQQGGGKIHHSRDTWRIQLQWAHSVHLKLFQALKNAFTVRGYSDHF